MKETKRRYRVMDVIFHLIKGVDIEKLFMDEEKREDSKRTTISGQAAVTDSTRGLAKMDSTKKFKPPHRAHKGETGPMDFDNPVSLSVQATKHLRTFVEEFLDAGFNPLFNHIRKAIDREAERIMDSHPRQFFYLVAWFLEAERARRRCKKSDKKQKPEDVDSFALVASVLNQEMFVTLNRAMDKTYEEKSWADLSAAMKCFTQILLTVQEMSESPLEDDQEIAENILNRIFYEETTHDRVANITRTYKDQGFGYLDSTTELSHNYLRILEQYSKQNVDLQVRSRRRVRKKKKAAREAGEDAPDDDVIDESEGEDESRAQKMLHERKFDFKKFAARFVVQGCVDTFVKFTSYYNDLKPAQLKRAHRYFYRVAFKQEMGVMLFRVDIIHLFNKMIKGPEGLDPQSSSYKEWEEFVKQILRRCFKKMQERPELVVEMLFSKINSTAHYLEYGYEKQTVTTTPRAAAALEVKPGMEWEEQVGIVVGALLDKSDGEHLQWIKSKLKSGEDERRSWEGLNAALPSVKTNPSEESSETPAEQVEAPKPPSIHLDPEGSWIIPSNITADQLKQSHDLIKQAEHSPPEFGDGQEAADFLRRQSAAANSRKRAVFDDDDGIDDDDEELMFEPGGPTAMKPSDALKELKKKRKLRRKGSEDGEEGGLTDEQVAARAEARRLKELEKNRKVKSDLLVHDSDDEDDEARDAAFFAEEAARQAAKIATMKSLLGVGKPKPPAEKSNKKRQSNALSDASNDDEVTPASSGQRKRVRSQSDSEDDDHATSDSPATAKNDPLDSDAEGTVTPMSSPHTRNLKGKKRKVVSDDQDEELSVLDTISGNAKSSAMVIDDDDDEDDIPIVKPVRQRVRAGFIVDSSDEE
ncbi:putative Topoisomerase 1-associated factor 1 [Glarea lozoyensis 74030]|uniref:Putative Topoisomerase 1-associated factor 1 n=1 Tax=Glarea lozoyensis (strain ATCC 74030 / MF5533) TaxID=1104152 RepID=H0ECP8_GLAL7|nr:putative Topoisomerase 1-associated factor 1 [Glarea lozoyensis 74030]